MEAWGCAEGPVRRWAKRSVSWTEDPGSAWDCTSKQKEFGWSDNDCGVKFGGPWLEIKDFRKAAQMPFPRLQDLAQSFSGQHPQLSQAVVLSCHAGFLLYKGTGRRSSTFICLNICLGRNTEILKGGNLAITSMFPEVHVFHEHHVD